MDCALILSKLLSLIVGITRGVGGGVAQQVFKWESPAPKSNPLPFYII